jgi:hypothetical protein
MTTQDFAARAPATREFDLDRYVRDSKKVDLTDGLGRCRHLRGLRREARCLAFMMDIESHTVMYARDLLATWAAFDPDVTAFMACWIYEEFWHGEAL